MTWQEDGDLAGLRTEVADLRREERPDTPRRRPAQPAPDGGGHHRHVSAGAAPATPRRLLW
ncbi:MAG: hypothetical protein U0736_26550 [Gemmataceae bacterium]